MNKQGKAQSGLIWLVLIVGAVWLISSGSINLGGTGTTTSTTTTQTINTCKSTTTPSLTINAVDKYNPGTSFANATMTYITYIGGKTAAAPGELTTLVGSPLKLSVNKDYFILGKNTSTYYTIVAGSAPCQNVLSKTIDAEYKGAPTLTFYNSDGQPSTVQAVGAGAEKVVSFKIEGPNNKCTGNPRAKEVNPNAGLVVAFDYKTANWTSVAVEGAKKTDVPGLALGTYEEAYLLPEASICDLADKTYKVTLKAKSGVDPEGTSGNITARIYDPEIYVNSDTGAIEAGVETEDDADVGLSSADTVVILVS